MVTDSGPSRVPGNRGGNERWASDGDEADGRAERLQQVSKVDGVAGDEGGRTGLRSSGGYQRDGRVDDVGRAGTSAQQSSRAC